MTDDLVKRYSLDPFARFDGGLHHADMEPCKDGDWVSYADCAKLADRIEELSNCVAVLEAKLATCEKYRDDYADRLQAAEGHIEKLEAKLAKAVEVFVEAVWAEYTDSIESKWTFRKEHVQNAILRALAELKGEDRG